MPERIIAIGGLKGGIGKSTLGIFLAFYYAAQAQFTGSGAAEDPLTAAERKRVLFVDADPASQTGYDWHKLANKTRRAEIDAGRPEPWPPMPFDLETWPHSKVGEMITDRTDDYDTVIVDCGGDSDAIFASAVTAATDVLMVTTPSKVDIRRLGATFEAAKKAAVDAGRDIGAYIVFTKVDQRRESGREGNAARRHTIHERGLPLLDAELSLIPKQYSDAFGRVVGPSTFVESGNNGQRRGIRAVVRAMESEQLWRPPESVSGQTDDSSDDSGSEREEISA